MLTGLLNEAARTKMLDFMSVVHAIFEGSLRQSLPLPEGSLFCGHSLSWQFA
ncbi:hypothetical protein D083_2859 [Dickeya solani RNS 08.23.3.1.A]|nr:hypothetical protein D083_2859 [Dickeya solani RNS 08.23.3.1.A]